MADEATVLLDNATISSALRALGYATCPNKSVFDLDLANLSTVVDAVLLADHVAVPATYKPEFQSQRSSVLEVAGINNVTLENAEDREIEAVARNVFSRWTVDYEENGNGILRDLMALMGVYMRFVWNYRSSESWLVLRAFEGLEGTPTSKLPQLEGLLTEENDGVRRVLTLAASAEVFVRKGIVLEGSVLRHNHRIKPVARKIMAALAWNVLRAVYYRLLAAERDMTYLPHSLRTIGAAIDAVTANDCRVDSATLARYDLETSRRTITESIESIMRRTGEELASIGAISGSVTNLMPPLLGYIASNSSSRDDFMENLRLTRDKGALQDLRGELREFEESVRAQDMSRVRKWKLEVQSVCSAVTRELGLDTAYFEISPFSVLSGGTVTLTGLRIPIPDWLHRVVGRPSNWRLWYREVAITLRNVARLGDMYEKIQSWAMFKENDIPIWYAKKDYPTKYTRLLDDGVLDR